ncbi:hypothetical protein ACFLT8_03035, partial [Chloroflexota bacterium]
TNDNWVYLIFVAGILLIAHTQEVPLKAGTAHWEIDVLDEGDYRNSREIQRWTGEPDWNEASWEIRMGRQYIFLTVPLGLLFLYGALTK